MALRTVRSADALARNPHKVGVQFPVQILVVEDRYCVGTWNNAREFADRMPIGDNGTAKVDRRLAAILAADIAGYSRLMEQAMEVV